MRDPSTTPPKPMLQLSGFCFMRFRNTATHAKIPSRAGNVIDTKDSGEGKSPRGC